MGNKEHQGSRPRAAARARADLPTPLASSLCCLQVELAPRGQDTPVTADNRLAYIHRVADYRLNQQIREPAAAFLRCVRWLWRSLLMG